MRKIILLTFCIFYQSAPVSAETTSTTTCEKVESYVPPDKIDRPHVLKTGFSDLVFWPSYIDKLELNPWSLVCHEVCMLKDNVEWYKDRKVYTIKALHHIKIKHKKVCNKA
jgi:hypothetical protein